MQTNLKRLRNEHSTLKKKYDCDIICGEQTIEKFLRLYSAIIESYNSQSPHKKKRSTIEDKEISDYEKMIDMIKIVIENNLWTNIKNPDDYIFDGKYKIEDKVLINYVPYSQKYIEHYEKESFCGKIFFIDNQNDNMFLIQYGNCESNDENIIRIKSLERVGCHYLGMGKSYDYFITQQ